MTFNTKQLLRQSNHLFMGGISMISFIVNKQRVNLDVDPATPLLWVLRESLGLTGTKFGCGMAQCGACTVHLNGEAVRSCVTPVSRAAGKQVVTIEGLSPEFARPLQQAWIAEDVPQCRYCQSAQVMAAGVGGALVLGVYLPSRAGAAQPPSAPFAPNAFLRIGKDETVAVIVPHSEVGQGPYTSIRMVVAEELDADWTKDRFEPGPVAPE